VNKSLYERFNQEFEKSLPNHQTTADAFTSANKNFEEVCGFQAYKNYDSFKVVRNRKRKKGRS